MISSIIQDHKKFLCSYPVKRWFRESLAEKYSEDFLKVFSEYTLSNLRENKSAEKMLITHGFKKLVNGSAQPFRLFYFGDYSQLVLVSLEEATLESAYPEQGDGSDIIDKLLQEILS